MVLDGRREPEDYVSSYFQSSPKKIKEVKYMLDVRSGRSAKIEALRSDSRCQCMIQVAKSVEKTGRNRPDSINLRLQS